MYLLSNFGVNGIVEELHRVHVAQIQHGGPNIRRPVVEDLLFERIAEFRPIDELVAFEVKLREPIDCPLVICG